MTTTATSVLSRIAVLAVVLAGALALPARMSAQRGTIWTPSGAGTSGNSIESIARLDGNLYATANENTLFVSSDNGLHWTDITSSLPNHTGPATVEASNGSLLVGLAYMGANVGGGIYRSTDHGATWSRLDNGVGQVGHIVSAGNRIVIAATGPQMSGNVYTKLYYSPDNGASWVQAAGLPFEEIAALRFVGSTLFAGTPDGIFRSYDSGATWSAANNGITEPLHHLNHIIALGEGDGAIVAGSIVYADTVNIFRSTDNGDSWQPVLLRGQPSGGISCFAMNGSMLYAARVYPDAPTGTVLRSTDNGATWQPYNDGLENRRVNTMLYDGGALYAGTIEDGIYRTSVPLGVEREGEAAGHTMLAVYPNPSHGTVAIHYRIPDGPAASHHAEIEIFDALGRQIRQVSDGGTEPGSHDVRIETSGLVTGTYFCRLQIGTERTTRSFVVLGE
ncbi:MAG TPA: T9SS type A sorting domain-containing protein [Candidatus Kapabacteria bacterium]|nr:T9SS type A sorting domain-containing protein [Candidatus Kapabacteria bacterium]